MIATTRFSRGFDSPLGSRPRFDQGTAAMHAQFCFYDVDIEDERAARWNTSIRRLREWENDPSRLEDDGVDAPTLELLQRVIRRAEAMRDQGLPGPTRVSPTGDGGITFERSEAAVTEVLEFDPIAGAEWKLFMNDSMVHRLVVSFD